MLPSFGFFLFSSFLCWRRMANKANVKCIKTKKTCRHRGEAGCLGCERVTTNDPTKDNPPNPLSQGPPPPYRPRTISKPPKQPSTQLCWATYLRCCFHFHSMCKMLLLQRTFYPSKFVKAMEHGHGNFFFANLNMLDHPFPCRFGVDDKFIPNVVLDLRLVPLFMVEYSVIVHNVTFSKNR